MATIPTTNTAQQSPDKQRTQQRGTGFTNLNRILDANKGAGEKMGQKIGGQMQNQADSVRQGIAQSQQQFSQQKQQAGQQAQNAIQAGQQYVKQAGENDDQYAQRVSEQPSETNFAQIGQNLKSAQYTGPMGLNNAGQIQAGAQNASDLGKLAGTTQGQQQLLKTMVAAPGQQYTAGQNSLDSILLGQGGQGSIQQGRNSTVGLSSKASDAVTQAEKQAQALSSGINTNRDKALTDLRNAVTGEGGFSDQALKQAQNFQTDASDLARVLSGNYDTSTPEGMQRAQDLVNRMGEFGLDDYNLYSKDENATKSALGHLAGTLSQDFGNRKYTDPQKQASLNLASLLGDEQLSNEIKNNKFNTDVFGKEEDSFGNLDKNRTYDTESQNILKSLSSSIAGVQNNVMTQNNAKIDQTISNINSSSLPDEIKQQLLSDLEQTREAYSTSLSGPNQQTNNVNGNLSKYFDTRGTGLVGMEQQYGDQTYNQILQLLSPALGQLQGRDAVRAETDRTPQTDTSQYGFLAFGDRGDQDITERFRGLGLDKETPMSGQYRDTQSLDAAAQKVLGPDMQMKDFVLKKMLGLV